MENENLQANEHRKSLIFEVEREERRTEAEIEDLQADLNALRRIKNRILSIQRNEMGRFSDSKAPSGAVGPQEAIRKIIYVRPDRKWTPRQISRFLVRMINAGEVATNLGPNTPLNAVIHSVLKRLSEKAVIEKGGEKGSYWYRKPIVIDFDKK